MALSNDLKTIYSSYSDNRQIYETLEFSHSNFTQTYRIIRDVDNHDFDIDISSVLTTVTFTAWNFNAKTPEVGSNQQEITVVLDNVQPAFVSILSEALGSNESIKMIYRVFIDGSNIQQQNDITLHVVSTTISNKTIELKASRPDLFKRTFPAGEKGFIGNQFPAIRI